MNISRTVMISGIVANLNEPIYLYRGDGDIYLSVDIVKITESSKLERIIIENLVNENVSHSKACLCGQNGISLFEIDGTKIDDRILFIIPRMAMDDIEEVGEYKMQIHLFDSDEGRLTLPAFGDINIMMALCDEANSKPISYSSKVGDAMVGHSMVAEDINMLSDSYHTYNWTTGEYITAGKLNNIMHGVDEALQVKDEYATKDDLNGKANKDHTHPEYDIDLNEYALKEDIPNKLSELQNDTDYATQNYVQDEILKAQLNNGEGNTVDLSRYATKDELNDKVDKGDLPTKVSQLENDSGYITNIPSEYITENELEQKKYLTEHQDISHLAKKDDLHSHNNKNILDNITSERVSLWDNKSEFSGSYNDLTNKPTIPSLNGYATETYVNTQIANAQLSGGDNDVDLSGYATKDELNNKADKSSIPTKVSQLENDSKYLTNVPNEYITETELNQRGYLTEHQDVSHLAEKSELHSHNNKNILDGITSNKITSWDNKSEFDGDYNSLINKPTIPSLNGYATETYVKNEIANAQLGGDDNEVDLSGYATKDELNDKANKTDIPTKVSQLENDNKYISSIPSEYITESELNQMGYLTEHQDISHLAKKTELHSHNNKSVLDNITSTKINSWDNKSEFSGNYGDLINKPMIPSKTSDLTNDSGYLTSIPSEYITETELNQKGYLTEHQDISGKADKSELHSHSNKTVLDGITSTKITEWDNKSTFSGSYNDLTNKPTIPTTTNQLTNNSGFLTSIPSEYITETELNQKGYLTNIPSEYITETELNNSLSNYTLKSEQLVTVTISNRRLTLKTDKRQVVTMANNTTITLPSVSSFTEIHLYFTASSNYTITFPSVKWQKTPSVASGKSYEFIFTYVNSSIGWLGGFIEYGN